ncbi:MAG: hypothetical protein ACTSVI_01385 [Promethearchaeota archaeon]
MYYSRVRAVINGVAGSLAHLIRVYLKLGKARDDVLVSKTCY